MSSDDVDRLFNEVEDTLSGVFGQMDLAEEEIAAGKLRHPLQADLIDRVFALARPTHELMRTSFVYRAHVRELVERAAAQEDTRPGTAAEVAAICCETSLAAPLTAPGMGLYARIWAQAFPDQEQLLDDNRDYYERSHGSEIDRLEDGARRRAAQEWRRLKPSKSRRSAA